MGRRILAGTVLAMLLACVVPGHAKVTGQCSNCHTMHNSQGGSPMAFVMEGGSRTESGALNPALLTTDCVGCHQGINSGGTIPYVFSFSSPVYGDTGTEAGTTTLAGGNFYWVAQGNDRKGHNVAGITGQDDPLGVVPPGGSAMAGQITCAGTLGCHGDPQVAGPTQALLGGHHNKEMGDWQDGSTVPRSYRFLLGIQGLEDPAFEFRPTQNQHNKYYGQHRNSETVTADGSISSLCARCHADFHNGSGKIASGSFGSGVWLRHPVDFDMSRALSSDEYTTYNGGDGTANPYSVVAPVATESTSTEVNTSVDIATTGNNNAIVMCLSCHRGHGTPHDAILRWDYKLWPQPGGYNGCAVCHTSKD